MAQQVREIKVRIQNIKDIKQITKAMHAIAITKVTQMTRRLNNYRRYLSEAENIMRGLSKRKELEKLSHPILDGSGTRKEAVFVANSDRGLCGRFKGDLNKAGQELTSSKDNAVVIAGGEKAASYFEKTGIQIIKGYTHFYVDPKYTHAEQITRYLLELFSREKIGTMWAVYMHFISDLRQEVRVQKLLPIEFEDKEKKETEKSADDKSPGKEKESYIYEPDLPAVLDSFAPFYLKARIYGILLESKTSEHAMRIQAMKKATDNAKDLIQDLTLSFNKARQTEITREIADIIGGAEALREK